MSGILKAVRQRGLLMNSENHCPDCGAELAANALAGLCPACLLKEALHTQSFPSGEAESAGEAPFVPPKPEELAAHFPDLEILEFIGRGGMGMVYKARQRRLDRMVALKILSPKIGHDPAFAERFAREARAMALLSHPHIVTVYDFGQTTASPASLGIAAEGEEPLYYFLMEFVDGLTLRQLLDTGRIAPEEALAIVPQICEALQYAHDKGVVHRDIKPENILLAKSGEVKIADFGLAKLMRRETKDYTLTGEGQVMGTPQYMAPEQIEHPQEVDHRADIYSLGVVFYQMLTGELPIGRFAAPSKKVEIDVRLDEVVLRALEKEPELRYQRASEIKTQVESIVHSPVGECATGTADLKAAQSSGAPPPDTGRANGTSTAIDQKVLEQARWQVSGPSVGLLALGLLELLMVPVMFTVLVILWMRAGAAGIAVFALILPGLVVAIGALTIAAALKMRRLEGYGLAIAASILALIVSPSNLIGLAIGIWSLVVLCREDVAKAFEQNRRAKPATPVAGKTAAIIAGTLLVVFGPLLVIGMARAFLLNDFGNRTRDTILQPSNFGPVLERTVETSFQGKYAIDLDKGMLHTPPAAMQGRDEQARNHWIRAVGADAVANLGSGLIGRDMLLTSVDNSTWDRPSAAMIQHWSTMEPARPGVEITAEMPGKGRLPVTYLFKTREGSVGLLQIVGFTDDPPGVKIRYKLVRGEAQNTGQDN